MYYNENWIWENIQKNKRDICLKLLQNNASLLFYEAEKSFKGRNVNKTDPQKERKTQQGCF